MFRNNTATAPPADTDVIDPATLVPLSQLELDVPAPTTGWLVELDRRHIEVLDDDLGRLAISRADARALMWERREQEALRREAVERQREAIEQRAIEADRVFRANLWGGMPADQLPDGVSAAELWAQTEKDSRPKRETPLQHALANDGVITYHPLSPAPDES